MFIGRKRPHAKAKLPWMFSMKDDQAFPLAGVWRSPLRQRRKDTFAIITTKPSELLFEKTGHGRLPVIIKRAKAKKPDKVRRKLKKNQGAQLPMF